MNSNLFHNIANVAIAALSGITAFMLATGCVQAAGGALDCSASALNEWVNPTLTASAVAVLGVAKSFVNVVRDGFKGLVKEQPPVE